MLPDGKIFTSEVIGGDFSDRDYFQAAMQGKTVVLTVIFGLLILIFPYTVLFRRRGFESSLLEVAYIDELTGAANHTLFVKGSEQLLQEQGPCYACIVLNIHRFKLINDLFGFTYGDSLLKQIASMLPSVQNMRFMAGVPVIDSCCCSTKVQSKSGCAPC